MVEEEEQVLRRGREGNLALNCTEKWAVYSKSPVINPTNQYICGSYSPKEEMDHDVTVKTLVDRAKREEAAVGVTLALACAPCIEQGTPKNVARTNDYAPSLSPNRTGCHESKTGRADPPETASVAS